MNPFEMVVAIVFLGTATGTIHKYLETRVSLARSRGGPADKSVLNAIQELRAEIAALKQHETEAVLSFDSTLQAMQARLNHLERRSVAEGTGERMNLAPPAARPLEEPMKLGAPDQ